MYSPLWKITHQQSIGFMYSPLWKSPIETHRFCVLPPLKKHCFCWALISGWAFISVNTVCYIIHLYYVTCYNVWGHIHISIRLKCTFYLMTCAWRMHLEHTRRWACSAYKNLCPASWKFSRRKSWRTPNGTTITRIQLTKPGYVSFLVLCHVSNWSPKQYVSP